MSKLEYFGQSLFLPQLPFFWFTPRDISRQPPGRCLAKKICENGPFGADISHFPTGGRTKVKKTRTRQEPVKDFSFGHSAVRSKTFERRWKSSRIEHEEKNAVGALESKPETGDQKESQRQKVWKKQNERGSGTLEFTAEVRRRADVAGDLEMNLAPLLFPLRFDHGTCLAPGGLVLVSRFAPEASGPDSRHSESMTFGVINRRYGLQDTLEYGGLVQGKIQDVFGSQLQLQFKLPRPHGPSASRHSRS
ncbi:hypothetical protein B0H16DRAFT_1451543 [Mycena metata]|uniref:Uncharacterized protein n=1 Tax=Mycena metata TaxID=1033252 RepID=A0AAD7JZC9_9AGAR|nr:hypothetical protein B0H16DRAFT_1451543 [Mycena metata]